jgi:hypothetical protein
LTVDTVSAPKTVAQTNLTVTAGRATSTEIGSPERAVTVVPVGASIGRTTCVLTVASRLRGPMTNRELIEKLQALPLDLDVCLSEGKEWPALEINNVYECDDFICLEG